MQYLTQFDIRRDEHLGEIVKVGNSVRIILAHIFADVVGEFKLEVVSVKLN